MAFEYAKILQSLNKKFIVIGRSNTNNSKFIDLIGAEPFVGGIDKYLQNNTIEINSQIIILRLKT